MITNEQSEFLCGELVKNLEDNNLSSGAQKMLLYAIRVIKGAVYENRRKGLNPLRAEGPGHS